MALIEVLEFDSAEQVVEEGQNGLELLSLLRTEMLEREVPTYEMLLFSEQGPPGPPGPQGSAGAPGPQGESGHGITFLGELASTADLPAAGDAGDAFAIAGRIFLRTAAGDWVDAGPVGAPGKDGQTNISADTPNRLRLGSDGGLYVPDDLVPDPLAYYILAKA